MKSALIPALALSLLVTAETARAGDPNYDPDCHDLLAAYDKTRNTSRYQEVIYVQRPGKPPEQHSEERWDGINRYWKVAGGAWTRQYRDMLQSMVNNVPRFYGCRRQADEDVGGTAAITITGDWRYEPNFAIAKAWISKQNGKLLKVERTFNVVRDYGVESGDTATEHFTYDRDQKPPM
ncbi:MULTISPECIES: hypothetical protein [unclassified Phyllobacterium]|uniref:hypothetical protein n=1 Tax=unclassified Phyllobacterium TaxID=2638441 RepID=UPI0008EE5634|nr:MULTISPECIES: hypothetical protein [unclassified Phyllobacterium]SFI48538.1 hypothetical protein SAMN04515648_0093 [Phyllobacterium sp. CL33Tsu]